MNSMLEYLINGWNKIEAKDLLLILIAAIISTLLYYAKRAIIFIKKFFSKDYRNAKKRVGEYYLYHPSLIKSNESNITVSKLKIQVNFVGLLKISQLNIVDNKIFFKGYIKTDFHCLYCVMKGESDTDHKLIIFQNFNTTNNELLLNAVGTMSGITLDRNPYSTLVLITKKPLPISVINEFFGKCKSLIASKPLMEKIQKLYKEKGDLFKEEVDPNTYRSSLSQ